MLTQISVFLENRSGQLVQITDILAKNNVNIRAINIAETSDYGVLRMVVDNPEKTAEVLKGEGFIVKAADVVAAAVPDCVGGLNKLLMAIADRNIDIEYMYSIFGKSDGLAYMIFKVADPTSFRRILKEEGFVIKDDESL